MSKEALEIFKALGDDMRIKMIEALFGSEELSCGDLSKKFSLSQPAFSHHVNKLADAELVKVRKAGTRHFYSLNKDRFVDAGIDLEKIVR